ncbi:hypothetical protein, partial [Xanthomonas vesicatoria]|uniref:hypothetical protein n=1 Tax=Xanthomonas vesicatoria TaxID=56460 RepID=UPI0019D1DD52
MCLANRAIPCDCTSVEQGHREPPLITRTPESEDNPRREVFDAEAAAVYSGVQAGSSAVAQGG